MEFANLFAKLHCTSPSIVQSTKTSPVVEDGLGFKIVISHPEIDPIPIRSSIAHTSSAEALDINTLQAVKRLKSWEPQFDGNDG